MADNTSKIKCANCRFVRADDGVSDYTPKRCDKCDCREDCELEGSDVICAKQTVKWRAYECGCGASDYFKALLNVRENGDRLERITWSGCEYGRPDERRDGR